MVPDYRRHDDGDGGGEKEQKETERGGRTEVATTYAT